MSSGEKQSFLIAYDQGKIGCLWGEMEARSADEILGLYPEATVVAEQPTWMTNQRYRELSDKSYDIDGEPCGLLDIVLGDRRAE